MAQNREYVTAITITAGIITLITPNGEIANYRQRGIDSIEKNVISLLVHNNLLTPYWGNYKELPKLWSISFEDPEIMGKARAGFQIPKAYKQLTNRR